MKNLLIFFLLISFNYSNAQTPVNKFVFDLNTLSSQKAYAVKNISPRIENGKFFYYNQITRKKEFENGFEEAYPFIGKSALIKKNGKYGVIDLKGNYIIKPIHDNYELPPYEYESNLVIFSEKLTFDLNLATKSKNGYIYCAEPAVPEFKTFSNEMNKYGIKNSDNEIIIEAKYDSIIDIHFDFFVVKSKGKIGVISIKGDNLIDIDYEEITFSRGDYYSTPQTIGLKKGNKWTYFSLPDQKIKEILSSKYKCIQTHKLLINNAIGIFEKEELLNILFENGGTLDDDYDWISENGLVGIKNNSVFFLNPDGSSTLYYE